MFPFGLFCVYWLIFLGYTLFNFIEGGSHAVVLWYQHVSTEGCLDCLFKPWSLRNFLLEQLLMAVITVLLWLVVRRRAVAQEAV